MVRISEVEARVVSALQKFLQSVGLQGVELTGDLDLVRGLGLESDQGIDLALDLEDALGCKLPDDFNPIIHSSGERGMKLRELVEWAQAHVRGLGGGE